MLVLVGQAHNLFRTEHQRFYFFQQSLVYQIEVIDWHRAFTLGTRPVIFLITDVRQTFDLSKRREVRHESELLVL